MANINKLLDKVGSATEALTSLKDIKNKVTGKFKSADDELGKQREQAKQILEKRRQSLTKLKKSATKGASAAKSAPKDAPQVLQYPFMEELPNYILFKSEELGTKRNTDIAKDAMIKLYIPDTLNSTSTVSYETEDIGAAISEISNRLGNETAPNLTGINGGIKGILERTLRKAGEGISAGGQKLLNKAAGKAANPLRETFLKDLPFRTFNLSFTFRPKSEEEAQEVERIIHAFRLRQLPKLDPTGLFMMYPPTWNVEYVGAIADKIDGYLPNMVCTSMNVEYTGGQKFSAFTDGYPTAINMTLDFSETRILSRQNYLKHVASKNLEGTSLDGTSTNPSTGQGQDGKPQTAAEEMKSQAARNAAQQKEDAINKAKAIKAEAKAKASSYVPKP
jgi:hypothetical protein